MTNGRQHAHPSEPQPAPQPDLRTERPDPRPGKNG
jgi:hypothetical protein